MISKNTVSDTNGEIFPRIFRFQFLAFYSHPLQAENNNFGENSKKIFIEFISYLNQNSQKTVFSVCLIYD